MRTRRRAPRSPASRSTPAPAAPSVPETPPQAEAVPDQAAPSPPSVEEDRPSTPATPPEHKQRTKQLLFLLERALNVEERDRLVADAGSDAASLRRACEFVLELPRGAGLQGASWSLAWCTKRFRHISMKFLHPDKADLERHPSLLPRADDFDRAYKELMSTWQDVLKPLLEKSEGVYQEPAAPQPGEAEGASGARTPGAPRRRRRSQGAAQAEPPHASQTPPSPPPPPPMPKTPVEIFLSIDPTEGDLMACVLSVTSQARQRPKAKTRTYVELNERIRKEMALHVIDTATPYLLELASLGRVGEFGYACETGMKLHKHHGQGGVEVFSSGNVELAANALEALLDACVLPDNNAATAPHEVHDKGDDRSKEECIGYALKDMPEKIMRDGTSHPRAQQGKYFARPKVFYWRGNISDERAEECIMEYRKNNQYTGGPNFHKTGFAYGNGAGDKERSVIGLRNLMTWPVTHARRHGWLELADSFFKLLCLMFESGEYELGLELVDKASSRPEARLEALHKLNMNCGLASTTTLMKIVVSGLAQFEEASAAFLVMWRPPWRLSARLAAQMDRAEYTRYVADKRIPLRLSFVPQSAAYPRSELRGSGFVVDLNTVMGFDGALEALRCMDQMRLHVSTTCMYEHMRLYDADGHVACGAMAIVTSLLSSLRTFGCDDDFFSIFSNFVRHELEMRFFVDLNTGEYRDVIERHLAAASSLSHRSCDAILTHALGVPNAIALGESLNTTVTYHSVVSAATLNGLIRDSIAPKACAGLHFAIGYGPRNARDRTPLPEHVPADMQHHFLAVWATREIYIRSVD